ncbi:hypothetical protein AN960_08170 [Bacillus sp. FJAT-25509]|uniref:EF-hand domain-containing protein n=1 Tax=Bacillus sp. FJAT-25509 TaxID=1712029 RepID=UPI0006F908DF|nr:EF-hand domain-containing protein [Bacillus sp. FJAT-25509]KQL39939.1 hypothetical protein AN960_08170 [Bacillus sp. FJAT-25509]
MGYKNQRQLGVFFVISGVLVLLVSMLAYFKFSSTVSTDPFTNVQLDLSNKGTKKTTDLIYLKHNEKNGFPVEIKHSLKNSGNKDITSITLEINLLQKGDRNEGQFICLQTIKYGNKIYTLNSKKFDSLDLNKDGKISLDEFSKRPFPLGSLIKGRGKEFVLNGEYSKGLAPFNSDSKSTRIILDITYKIE